MSNSLPSIDVKNLLVAQGVGTFAGTSGWVISVGSVIEDPHTLITIFDTPGEPANPKFLLDFPRFQIQVRGSPNDYVSAGDKALEIKNVLLGLTPQDLDGTRYDGILSVTDTFFLKADQQGRPVFVTNYRAIVEPPDTGGNRIAL